MHIKFLSGKVKENENSEDVMCRWEIRMDLTGMWWDVVDWVRVAQDTDQWRAFVNTVMNFRVP